MGLGRHTVNIARPLVRPLAQGLEVMLHQRATWELSLWECVDIQTEAVSTHYPGLRAGGWDGGPGQFEDCVPQSPKAHGTGIHQPGPGLKAAASLSPTSTSMTHRQQQSTWAVVPRYLGSWRKFNWPLKRSFPSFCLSAHVSSLGPVLISCPQPGGGGEVRDGVQGSYTSLLEDSLCSWGLSQRG